MSVLLTKEGAIVLEGRCPVEEAEELLQLLLSRPGAVVDWRLCTAAHSAVVQVLLATSARILGPPLDLQLERWVGPALAEAAQ